MIDVKRKGDVFTIRFSRHDVTNEFLERLLREIELEKLLAKNKMTADQAWQLSEEIKAGWWAANQKRIQQLIGA